MAPYLLPKISGSRSDSLRKPQWSCLNNFGVKYAKFGVFANPERYLLVFLGQCMSMFPFVTDLVKALLCLCDYWHMETADGER